MKKFTNYFLCLAVFAVVSCTAKEKPLFEYRNVLVIVSDDHAYSVAGCYGNEIKEKSD